MHGLSLSVARGSIQKDGFIQKNGGKGKATRGLFKPQLGEVLTAALMGNFIKVTLHPFILLCLFVDCNQS